MRSGKIPSLTHHTDRDDSPPRPTLAKGVHTREHSVKNMSHLGDGRVPQTQARRTSEPRVHFQDFAFFGLYGVVKGG